MPLDNIFTILLLLLVTRYKKSKVKLWETLFIVRSGRKHLLGLVQKVIAYCKICLKSFRIDNSALSQVKSHEKCHKPGQTLSSKRTFEIGQKGQISLSKSSFVLTPSDQAAKAGILHALHMVNKNLSFPSCKEDSERFRAMFPDSMIAKSCSMADTKCLYVIKFGIADYLTKKLIYDANCVPFSFLFDESTNSQVKKQYGYV